MAPPLTPSFRGSRIAVLATLGLSLGACRPAAPGPSPEPEPPPPEWPFPPPPEPDLTPLDLSPAPLPQGVVAAVDGVPILEAELERLTRSTETGTDPVAMRSEALLQLVERRLLQAKADQLDVRASDDEVQRALDEVAAANGLTMEQLEAEVATMGWTWEEYLDELVAQLIEMKVLSIHGVLDGRVADSSAREALRARLVGCMRARAEIQVSDESLSLPENPFALLAEIAGVRFSGDLGLPEPELRTAADAAAKSRVRLCDALTSIELAVQGLYLERGYLEADVKAPWPTEPTPPVTVEVHTTAGRLHVIGTIAFDQSAAPRARRLDPEELRKRVAAIVGQGDVASMSTLQAASEEVSRAFAEVGLGPVEADVERKESKESVRLNITYRLVGSRT